MRGYGSRAYATSTQRFSRELKNYTGEEAARKPIPSGIFLCVFTLNLAISFGQLPPDRFRARVKNRCVDVT